MNNAEKQLREALIQFGKDAVEGQRLCDDTIRKLQALKMPDPIQRFISHRILNPLTPKTK